MDRECEHRWRYYVDIHSRAIRSKRCEICQERVPIGAQAVASTENAVRAA